MNKKYPFIFSDTFVIHFKGIIRKYLSIRNKDSIMKNINYLKIIIIIVMISISSEGVVNEAIMHDSKPSSNIGGIEVGISLGLLAPRALIPPSLEGRIRTTKVKFSKETNSSSKCNTSTSLCASFEGNITQTNVSAWMGFDFEDSFGKYFIATYGQKANDLGNGIYSTQKWDKRHLWLTIGKDFVPLALQTRYIGIDDESSNVWYSVDYIGFRKANAGIDYSKYPNKMSNSALLLLVNPKNKEVLDYKLAYYDENANYVQNYQIEVGDEIESYYIGFRKEEKDVAYLFSIEAIKTVTAPISFSYKEQYPGKDFNCTSCEKLNIAQVEFKYMFESYGATRSNFTEPQPLVKSSTANSTTGTTKSVPISGFWILFLLTMFVATLKIKQDKKKYGV